VPAAHPPGHLGLARLTVLCVGVMAGRFAGAAYPNQRHRGRRWAKAAVPTNPAARQVNPNDSTHLALVGIGSCGPNRPPSAAKGYRRNFPEAGNRVMTNLPQGRPNLLLFQKL
jgi:hypothetical protein